MDALQKILVLDGNYFHIQRMFLVFSNKCNIQLISMVIKFPFSTQRLFCSYNHHHQQEMDKVKLPSATMYVANNNGYSFFVFLLFFTRCSPHARTFITLQFRVYGRFCTQVE